MIAYKLFKTRKDGTIGPLFINVSQRIPLDRWLKAEEHPTRGFAFRPGWHCTHQPDAPHLTMRGRAWYKVDIRGVTEHQRPATQGGLWYTADMIRVLEKV